MTARVHECLECGGTREAGAAGEFCATACRDAFNNRRKARGAELYDLFMVLRFDRERAKFLRVFQALCRLASNWRREDRARRAGRRSWRKPEDVLETRGYLRAISIYDGTGRGRGAKTA